MLFSIVICCKVGPTLCPLLCRHLHPSPLLYAPPAHLAPSGAPLWPLLSAAGSPPANSNRGHRPPVPSIAPLALAPGNRYSAAFPRYRHGPVAHFKLRKQSLLLIKVPVPSGDGAELKQGNTCTLQTRLYYMNGITN